MKILYIDNQSIQNSIRIGLLEQMACHDVHLMDDFDEVMQFYREQKPQMVLIDFSLPAGEKALEAILKINPIQHIITLSDSCDISDPLGCDHCLAHYRKRRVLKHSAIHELLYMIENFSSLACGHAHRFQLPKDEKNVNKNEE